MAQTILFLFLIVFIGTMITTHAGITYYRQPTKEILYDDQSLKFGYPEYKKFIHPLKPKPYYSDLYAKDPLKYAKRKYLEKIKNSFHPFEQNHGVQYEWTADNLQVLPVIQAELNDYHEHQNHDKNVKPVEEHIEDDLKYDFRTETHSYTD